MRHPGCVSGIDNPQRYGLVGNFAKDLEVGRDRQRLTDHLSKGI